MFPPVSPPPVSVWGAWLPHLAPGSIPTLVLNHHISSRSSSPESPSTHRHIVTARSVVATLLCHMLQVSLVLFANQCKWLLSLMLHLCLQPSTLLPPSPTALRHSLPTSSPAIPSVPPLPSSLPFYIYNIKNKLLIVLLTHFRFYPNTRTWGKCKAQKRAGSSS